MRVERFYMRLFPYNSLWKMYLHQHVKFFDKSLTGRKFILRLTIKLTIFEE